MLIIIYCLVSLIIIIACTYYNYNKRYINGPRGPKGLEGPNGDKGDKGEKGTTGRMGQRGFRGLRGDNNSIQGVQGVDGYMGEKGGKGLQGYKGFKGKVGDRGERGPQGIKGNQGYPGQDGDPGIPGEYDYTLVDTATCSYYPFNKMTREMKCPYNYVLTGIKNQTDNFEGYCCKLKLNNACTDNGIARKLLDHKPIMVGTENEYKYATTEQQDEIYKYADNYGANTPLFYKGNYVCKNNKVPKLKGDIAEIRCCSKDNEEELQGLKYLKYY